MKLKAVLDTLDGVDEALKPAYTEKDGKFYLSVEGVDDHPDVKGLKATVATLRTEKRTLETKVSDLTDRYAGLPDDFTADEYFQLKDNAKGNVDQRLTDQKSRLEADFKRKEEKLANENTDLKGKLNKLHIDASLNGAIAQVGVAAPFADAVYAMIKDKTKVDYEGDEAIITIDNLPVLDYMKTWAGTEKGKHYIAAPANGGGGGGNSQPGAGGNAKDNPWSKEGFNLTKQAEIMASDPNKAAQLKAQAGAK